MRENLISKSIWVWWAMGFERDVDRREQLQWRSMKLLSCLQKRKLMPIWETLSLKNEGTASNLVQVTDLVGFGSSSSKFGLLQDTASSVKKVCLFWWGSPALVCRKTFALYLICDWCPALGLQIAKKPKKRLGFFSSLAQKTHRITLTSASFGL